MAAVNATIRKEPDLERVSERLSGITVGEPLLKPSLWQWRLTLILIYLTSLLNGSFTPRLWNYR
jgi:hypothetical protein